MKTKLILSILLIISITWNIFLLKEISSLKSQILNLSPKSIITQEVQKDCKTSIWKYNIIWTSMQPLIKEWSIVDVEDKYYECWKEIKRWDIVEVHFWYWDKMIKKLAWLPNDLISFNDKWNILINWEILKNSKNEKYVFSSDEIWNITPHVINWKLREDWFLIFWDNITNSIDSRIFWPVAKQALKWKVIKY